MTENEHILVNAATEELNQAIIEIEWASQYEITLRSQEIILAALRNLKEAREMYGEDEE